MARRDHEVRIPATATGSDAEVNVAEVDFQGDVTEVQYFPDTAITGVNSNTRTISIVNKGQAGTGTDVVATQTFSSGVNVAADDGTSLTVDTAKDNVAAGDVLAFQSTHVGTGLADPGGLIRVRVVQRIV